MYPAYTEPYHSVTKPAASSCVLPLPEAQSPSTVHTGQQGLKVPEAYRLVHPGLTKICEKTCKLKASN